MLVVANGYFPPHFGAYFQAADRYPGAPALLRDAILKEWGDLWTGGPAEAVLDGRIVGRLQTSVGTCHLRVRGTDGVLYTVTSPAHRAEAVQPGDTFAHVVTEWTND